MGVAPTGDAALSYRQLRRSFLSQSATKSERSRAPVISRTVMRKSHTGVHLLPASFRKGGGNGYFSTSGIFVNERLAKFAEA